MKNYIINNKTLAIITIDRENCKIVEENKDFICNMSIKEVINKSCLYYGASLQGRIDASRKILNKDYKVPIIIRESDTLILFPIGFKSNNNSMWISLSKLENYLVFEDKIEFIFGKNKSLFMNIKLESFENQLLKAYNLEKCVFLRSKN